MWMRVLGSVLAVPIVLAGCGDEAGAGGPTRGPDHSPSVACLGHASPAGTSLDLDGDGAKDEVTINGAPTEGGCRDAVIAEVGGHELQAPLPRGASPAAADLAAVRVSARTGDLLLMTTRHPRGGFQATLYGYEGGELVELKADGEPILPFIATDVLTDPIAARCVEGGFEIDHARRHEPIGVVPAWDVDRTVYTVDGNTVTRGATSEIADNVLEKDLHQKYSDLVDYSLFENCRA
jgi:hypothetical protein